VGHGVQVGELFHVHEVVGQVPRVAQCCYQVDVVRARVFSHSVILVHLRHIIEISITFQEPRQKVDLLVECIGVFQIVVSHKKGSVCVGRAIAFLAIEFTL
jgi:hypothetical protein